MLFDQSEYNIRCEWGEEGAKLLAPISNVIIIAEFSPSQHRLRLQPICEDFTLRPCFEDWIGAGAIISRLRGRLSPESEAALAAFDRVSSNLYSHIERSGSGKEKIVRGEEHDVKLASALNASQCVPILENGSFRREESLLV